METVYPTEAEDSGSSHRKAHANFFVLIFKNSMRNAKKTPHFTITENNLLMLYKEIIAVHSESQTKHISTKQKYKLLKQERYT
jgi:hypothetical protein